jgi:hypothetical protein
VVHLHGAGKAASIGLLLLTAGCAGSVVPGAVAPTSAHPRVVLATIDPPTMVGVGVGSETTVISGKANSNTLAGKSSLMQLPYAESFVSAAGPRAPRVVLISFSEQTDSRFVPELLRTERSVDGGKTFTQLKTGVPVSSMTQLADGSLVAVSFRTSKYRTSTHPTGTRLSRTTGAKALRTTYWRSHDYGATWVAQQGTITAGSAYDVVYFQRGIVVGRDGSLLATTYGYLHGETKYRSMLARSTDGGATWAIVSTIARLSAGGKTEGMSEPTMARAANGDLVVVMRRSAPINRNVCNGAWQGAGLVITRSSDDGATWAPVRPLAGAGLDVHNVSSADPHLTRMGEGPLILSYGRPGNRILVSTDGSGKAWGNMTLTDSAVSSGYTSIVALTDSTALQVGDHGSNWCFPFGSGLHTVGIWARTIVLRERTGT